MSVRADAETLHRLPLFAQCDPVHLQVLAFSAERRNFDAGESLIVQGETGSAAFLLLSGSVEVRSTEKGKARAVATAEPGALLGEVGMIGGMPFGVTAIAQTPVTTARIDRKLLFKVAEAYPDFGAAVFKTMARRLDATLKDLDKVRSLIDSAQSFARRL